MIYVNDTLILEAKYKGRSNFYRILDWLFSYVNQSGNHRIFYFTFFGFSFYYENRKRRN